MLGNVWERVEDVYDDTYRGKPMDGSAYAPTMNAETRFVNRGGAWWDVASNVRSTNRGFTKAEHRSHGTGFRVARDVAAQ